MNGLGVLIEIGAIQGAVLSGAVLCLAIAFRAFHFPDLSVEGSFPVGAATAAAVIRSGHSPWLGLACGGLAGASVGALTAALHTQFRINRFVSGILVVAGTYSLTLHLLAGSNASLLNSRSIFDGVDRLDQRLSGFPPAHHARLLDLLAVSLALTLIATMTLRSRWGLAARAAAISRPFAREHGLPERTLMIAALAGCNLLAGLSGGALAMMQGFADVGMGQGMVVLALASLSIGEALLPLHRLPRHLAIGFAALLGTLSYNVLATVALRLGVPSQDLRLVTALLVTIVLVTRWRKDLPEVFE